MAASPPAGTPAKDRAGVAGFGFATTGGGLLRVAVELLASGGGCVLTLVGGSTEGFGTAGLGRVLRGGVECRPPTAASCAGGGSGSFAAARARVRAGLLGGFLFLFFRVGVPPSRPRARASSATRESRWVASAVSLMTSGV